MGTVRRRGHCWAHEFHIAHTVSSADALQSVRAGVASDGRIVSGQTYVPAKKSGVCQPQAWYPESELNDAMNRKDHWEQVYQTKAPDDVSWFQMQPAISIKLIESSGVGKDGGIIDVGGGASVLVDCLLNAGYSRLALLDISAAAIEHARRRLGKQADAVEWLEADVTTFQSARQFGLWHDRAVFHFLTDKGDRQRYVETLKRTLTPGGQVVIASFAIDGPLKCSGLEVARYDAATLNAELGQEFQLIEQVNETHTTPWATEQKFSYFRFKQH
jgi:ubiquinone/menaquinone biosynthesis C-methylase UbiE